MIKAIFFDALGTLFYLTKTVGDHYAAVGAEIGLALDADKLDRAFVSAGNHMPKRTAIDGRARTMTNNGGVSLSILSSGYNSQASASPKMS